MGTMASKSAPGLSANLSGHLPGCSVCGACYGAYPDSSGWGWICWFPRNRCWSGAAGSMVWRTILRWLVGGWLLNVIWQQWKEVIARQPLEAGTAVRRLFLYAAIVMTTLGVLIPLGETLRLLLIALFDLSSFNGRLFLVDSLPRLSWLVTSGVALWLLQRYLAQEIERAGATPAARTVRRIILPWRLPYAGGALVRAGADALFAL